MRVTLQVLEEVVVQLPSKDSSSTACRWGWEGIGCDWNPSRIPSERTAVNWVFQVMNGGYIRLKKCRRVSALRRDKLVGKEKKQNKKWRSVHSRRQLFASEGNQVFEAIKCDESEEEFWCKNRDDLHSVHWLRICILLINPKRKFPRKRYFSCHVLFTRMSKSSVVILRPKWHVCLEWPSLTRVTQGVKKEHEMLGFWVHVPDVTFWTKGI